MFARLVDLSTGLPSGRPAPLSLERTGRSPRAVRIFERRRLMGRELHTELEVTAFDPPRRLTLKALNGPIKFTVDHRLEEEDGGTRLHVLAEGKAGGLMKLGEPVLARRADAELRQDFARLKDLLERA